MQKESYYYKSGVNNKTNLAYFKLGLYDIIKEGFNKKEKVKNQK